MWLLRAFRRNKSKLNLQFLKRLIRRKVLRYKCWFCEHRIKMQLAWFTTLITIYIVKVNIYFHILFLEVFISNDSYHFVFQCMRLLESLAGWGYDETVGPKHCEFGHREFKVYFCSVSRWVSRREQTTHIYINPGRMPGIGNCPIDQ